MSEGKRSPPGSLSYGQGPQTHAPAPAHCSEAGDGNPSCSLTPCPKASWCEQPTEPDRGGMAAPGKGMPRHHPLPHWGGDHAAHLWSLQGGLEVLLGHPFLCHQEAPGHLGVLADQGGQWLLLDLDRPGRSSHRHGETKWRERAPGSLMLAWGALNTCTASLGHGHSPGPHHPRGLSCQFRRLGASSQLLRALCAWFLHQDFAQCLLTRFYLIKPSPSDHMHGNHRFNVPKITQTRGHAGTEHAHTSRA